MKPARRTRLAIIFSQNNPVNRLPTRGGKDGNDSLDNDWDEQTRPDDTNRDGYVNQIRSDGQPILPEGHLKKVNNHIFIV
jgi:hypothetical protein